MYKCTMDKGVMTFRGDDVTYVPGGQTLSDMDEVVREYNLVQEILRDHGWAFPVIERLNQRTNALLRNLMELYNGRNIQHSENDETASAKGGERTTSTSGGRQANEAKKGKGT